METHVQHYINKAVEDSKLSMGSVAAKAHLLGLQNDEPLIYGLIGMIRYAEAHEQRFEAKLKEDYVLGDEFLSIIKGYRGLLNGNGALANFRNISTDSKDNGVCESLFWQAMRAGGFTEADI